MAMIIDFSGKTVLVTGAGRGLGKAMALTFAGCGADVYLGNRKQAQGLETVREIEAMGRRAGFTACDVGRDPRWYGLWLGWARRSQNSNAGAA